ncbi:MAG: Rho termination factor N-terminal domain-containing protein [Acholeplasmatales bacterium]|nr:Rho termination factor N-terminal domain-containing protein [Acholeplasmatales bacterium]
MLADLAVNDPAAFASFAEIAKKNQTRTAVKENVVTFTKESAAQRALRAANEAKAPKAAKAAKAAAPKAEAKKEAPKAVVATSDLESKTVAELKEMAKEAGIKGISTMKKADLIAALSK